jgi:RND family efflux transporter MFP subunit
MNVAHISLHQKNSHGWSFGEVLSALSPVLLSILVVAAISGCNRAQSAPVQEAPKVTVAPVLERNITEWDEFTGRLDAVEKVEVRPRVSGYIERVAFTEGKEVAAGTLLFQIDPRPYQAILDQARAEEERVRTRSVLAKQEVERAEKMLAKRAISQEEMDERLNALRESESGIASAKAAVEQAALNLEFTHVTSPIHGRVSRAEVTAGNLVTVAPNPTLLTTVVSMNPIYAYFDGDEQSILKYAALARKGQLPSSRDVRNPVYLGLANEEGYPHKGYIDFMDNQMNPASGTLRVRAVFDNSDRLFTPGLFARIRLVGSGKYKAILIRDDAVGTDQDKKFVLSLAQDGTVQYQPVQLGPIVDGLRVVKQGLTPGDQIVVSGVMRVRPGMKVNADHSSMEAQKTGAAGPAGD